jgi:deoxyadenosine/deoxycytidine kinase
MRRPGDQPGFIIVEGPIGVGKTSLAIRLAESYNGEVVLEHPEENPFLERFYKSGRSAALPAQLFFLFHCVSRICSLPCGWRTFTSRKIACSRS